MISDENSAHPEESQLAAREPLTQAKRKRLQRIFEHGSKQMAQQNYDYATELFQQCVVGNPANLIYVQNYLGNLQKKYNNNKTGSKVARFKELGSRNGVKKALSHSQWDEVIRHGVRVLAVNPWDVTTLTAMATAAENMGDDEPELYYLKCALDTNSKDPDVNRQCAQALAARGEFDQAIACWHRVEQARPDNEEVQHEIARLAVEKTIKQGGYEEKDKEKKLGGDHRRGQGEQPERQLTMEEVLQRRIAKDPEELANYFELAQLHLNNEKYKEAEEVFANAFEASDGDPDVRERWEDAQLRHLRQQIVQCEDEQTRLKLRKEFIQKELALYQNRCQRYPHNFGVRYELGLRYQLNGQYNEAISEFQQARNDPRRKGLCMLALGQCFEKVGQDRLSMSHYQQAVEEIPDRDAQHKKDCLHRAGKLALALKDLDTAEKHLTSLAELDFSYKNVSELLEKIGKLRKNN
jgi:tetratricopeptide (TPR) repeat protein